jgi:hypothetical protein
MGEHGMTEGGGDEEKIRRWLAFRGFELAASGRGSVEVEGKDVVEQIEGNGRHRAYSEARSVGQGRREGAQRAGDLDFLL